MTISQETAKRNEAVNAIISWLWQFDEEDTRFMVLACAWSILLKAHHRDMTDEAGRMCAIHKLLVEGKSSEAERVSKLRTGKKRHGQGGRTKVR